MDNRKSGETGLAIFLTVGIMLLIGFCISSSKPKCAMGGCDAERTTDSQYCVLHDLSYRSYGNPDYNSVYKQSLEKRRTNTVSDTGIENYSNSQYSYNANENIYAGKRDNLYEAEEYDDSDDFVDEWAEEYDDPDDFADEWAEEFGNGDYDDGYDEAYDYWEEEME